MQEENLIEIPFFQRAYVWEQEQWEQLFDDLLKSFENKKEHFLGSVIVKQLPSNAGEGAKRSLIDGQQRLTTFSILIKALYDNLNSDDKADYAGYLFKRPTKEKNPKIKHSKIDSLVFNAILQAKNSQGCVEISNIIKNPKKPNNAKNKKQQEKGLIACYCYFSEKIKDIDDKKAFLDYILDSKLWVIINLEANEDEQKIFDSINTAGLRLTATDIIKNTLFDKAMSLQAEYEQWYSIYWESLFEKDEQHRDFWEQEVSTGRMRRVQSEIFLHAFAIIEGFFNPENDTLENLSAIYKHHIQSFNADTLKSFLQKISEYALLYQELPQIAKETLLSYENYEFRLFHILKITDTNTIIPLILYLKKSLHNDKELLQKSLYLLEVFVLTRWLCNKSTKNYNKFFPHIIKSLQKTTKNNIIHVLKKALQKEEIPTIKDIKDSLTSEEYYLSNKTAKLVLFWIELYRRHSNKNKQDIIELPYSYTLEHLMPQAWEEHWLDIGRNDENAESLIYQIGNMTLLKGGLNSIMRNQAWKIKLNGDRSRKNHIKTCADLLITKELLEIKKWDKYAIQERTGRLIQEFFTIWNLDFLSC